jgi:membrane protease YdiL (CAAX protease family)
MQNVFVNRHDQVRSGWKIAIVIVFYFLFSFIAGIVVSGLPLERDTSSILFSYVGQVVSILAVIAVLKIVDKKNVTGIGLIHFKKGSRDFTYGFLLGALFMTAIFITLFSLGDLTLKNSLTDPVISGSLLSGLLLFILVGFSEEMLFRGYCMTALQQMRSTWLTVLISSLIFSLAHGANPNVSLIGLINIFVVGVLFAYMFIKTGNLWMPIGFHISWNYFQGNIFGFPVSGTEPAGIYNVADVEGVLLSGGAFGPEGGILATVLLILGFVFVSKYNAGQVGKRTMTP